MGSVSRLQFSASGDDGVTARVCINRGEATVYGSLTVPNPNTALYDFSQVLKGNCGNFFGSMQDARTAQTERCISNNAMQSEAKLYLTIEGMSSTETQYSIESSHGNTFGELFPQCVSIYVNTRVCYSQSCRRVHLECDKSILWRYCNKMSL